MAFETSGAAQGVRRVDAAPVAIAAIIGVSLTVHFATPFSSDVSWLLTVCERMLDGQRLYVDILEVNPPMSPWLYLPFVALARAIGARPETVVTLGAVAFACLSLWLSCRIALAARLTDDARRWWIVGAVAFALAPIGSFAQREHFAVMAALPMLVALAARIESATPALGDRLAAGLLAGLAVAIKPHFALALVLPAALVIVHTRSLRPVLAPEILLALLVAGGYAIAALTVYPAFASDMLPIARAVYLPNRLPLLTLLAMPHVLAACGLVAGAALAGGDTLKRPLYAAFGAAFLGFFLAYLLQGRGWPYHLLPATTLALFAFGLVLTSAPVRAKGARALIASLALAAPALVATASEFRQGQRLDAPLIAALKPMGPGLKLALLSPEHAFASPLHRMIGATLVTRAPSLWISGNAVASCLKGGDEASRARCQSLIDRDRAMFREDVIRTPPDVIIVEDNGFDMMAWAGRDPELGRFLSSYRLLQRVEDGPDRLALYVPAAR